jgi:hypothetical protein
MPFSDLAVLATVFTGTAVAAVFLWRRGARGLRLFAATWTAFYGLVLTAMMAAHSIEILYHTIAGGTTFGGEPWVYNFRVYSLQLLGAVLFWQGAKCLRAVAGLRRGLAAARRDVLRSTLIVLALVVPLIPIHAFFGVLLTVVSGLNLLVLALTLRAPALLAVEA